MNRQEWFSKIGQLFVVGFGGMTMTDEVKKLIHDYRIGNFILFGRNIGTGVEVLELTSKLQEEAKKAGHEQPLLICTDQENGIVQRLKSPATAFPGAMGIGASGSTDLAYQIGKATGRELKEVGINWNLAPVVDVNNNPDNPVINVRSFGESPEKVKELALSWMKGCQEAGVATTLKHFPGHGDTNVDSHMDLPVIDHSLERLFEVELLPFIGGIKAGAATIMTAHIYFTALEKQKGWPATLSSSVLTGLLRERLGFNGVITTDCLEMNAILNTVGTANGAVHAIKAGADMAMISHTYSYQIAAIEALYEAIQKEDIPMEQIDASVNRIKDLKKRFAGEFTEVSSGVDFKYFGSQEHLELAKMAHRKSVCRVKGAAYTTPLADFSKVLAVYPAEKTLLQVEDRKYDTKIGEAIAGYSAAIEHCKIAGSEIDPEEYAAALKTRVKDYDRVVLFTLSFQKDAYSQVIDALSQLDHVVVISLRGPFGLRHIDNACESMCVFDDSPIAIHAALDVVFGKSEALGTLPQTL